MSFNEVKILKAMKNLTKISLKMLQKNYYPGQAKDGLSLSKNNEAKSVYEKNLKKIL